MQFSDTIQTITRESIVPAVSDTVLKSNVGLMRFLGNAKSWRSGFRLDVPIKYQKATTGGIVEVGGSLDTTRQVTRVKMQFQPQRLHKPVVIDDIEIAVNQGEERILELVATEMDSLAQDLADDLGGYLYTGTGASGTSFDSLLNAADDSTNFTTYGNISRSTYTSIKGYYLASVGALALSDLATAHDSVKVGSAYRGVIITTPSVVTSYEGLLQPTVRASYQANGFPLMTRTGMIASRRALGGDVGFDSLYWRGIPMAGDFKCTSGKMFFVDEDHFAFYGMDLGTVEGYTKFNTSEARVKGPQAMPIPKGFNYSGPIRATDMPATVGHLYYVGNFVCDDPRRLGSLHGVT